MRAALVLPALVLLPILGQGCGAVRPTREYLRLAVALGERDPIGLDYYFGPPEWVADIRKSPPSLAEIRSRAGAAAASLPANDFLALQLRAIEARADLLLGKKRTFADEARVFFRMPAPPDYGGSEAPLRKLRELIGGEPVAEKYGSFDRRFLIPQDKVQGLISRALALCRGETVRHLTLPPGERVTLEFVHDKPWSAYSYYQGNYVSIIQVNADSGLTLDRALTLACHEGYPGHHVFNTLVELLQVRNGKREELMAQPTYSPQSLVSEAAASVATDVVFPDPERLRLERDVLAPLAGIHESDFEHYAKVTRAVDALRPTELAIAQRYLDGDLEFMRAAEALREQAAMPEPYATLRYLNQYRSYAITYTQGRDMVWTWLNLRTQQRNDGTGLWGALRDLISNPDELFRK